MIFVRGSKCFCDHDPTNIGGHKEHICGADNKKNGVFFLPTIPTPRPGVRTANHNNNNNNNNKITLEILVGVEPPTCLQHHLDDL